MFWDANCVFRTKFAPRTSAGRNVAISMQPAIGRAATLQASHTCRFAEVIYQTHRTMNRKRWGVEGLRVGFLAERGGRGGGGGLVRMQGRFDRGIWCHTRKLYPPDVYCRTQIWIRENVDQANQCLVWRCFQMPHTYLWWCSGQNRPYVHIRCPYRKFKLLGLDCSAVLTEEYFRDWTETLPFLPYRSASVLCSVSIVSYSFGWGESRLLSVTFRSAYISVVTLALIWI